MSFGVFLGRKLPLMIASFFEKTGIFLIIETVVFLGRQNIPLRGHRDDGLLGGEWPAGPFVSATALNASTTESGKTQAS